MKNIALRKFFITVGIYVAAWVVFVIFFDEFLDGFFIDLIESVLGWTVAYVFSAEKVTVLFVLFILGLIVIAVIFVIRLSRLLTLASNNIYKDTSAILKEKSPEELRAFNSRLLEFKNSLAETERARQAAEQQKNDLILYLAHDLKTPLTSVIGYLDILKESPELSVEQRAKYTGVALDKAYRLEQLINEFFEITKLNLQSLPQDHDPVNLTVLMLQILDEFYPEFERKNLTVNQAVDNDIKVYGNAEQFARVFENIIKNAVNYGSPDTELDVAVVSYDAQTVLVMIRNRGEEIPPEKLKHLFDKFYRADNARQSKTGGSGLGLAIAKEIVKAYGGRIVAESNADHTEFRVYLPCLTRPSV